MKSSNRLERGGMTLIELVVALTITAMVTAAAYASFTTVIDQRERSGAILGNALHEAALRRQILDWLAGAHLLGVEGGPLFRALDGVHQGAADDELSFLTTARTQLAESETIVRLFIDRDSRTPETGLCAELRDPRSGRTQRLQIAAEVTSLNAQYLYGADAQREWFSSWVSSSVLPLGVELRLTGDPRAPLPLLLQLPIVVSFEVAR